MTTAIYNRVGQDSTSVEFITFGSNEAECHLKHELLDGQLDYHFGITSLSVPTNKLPIHPVAGRMPIIQLVRRNDDRFVEITGHPEPIQVIYAEFLELVEEKGSVADYQNFAAARAPTVNLVVGIGDLKEDIYQAFAAYFNLQTAAPLFGLATGTEFAMRIKPSDFQFALDPDSPHYSVNDFVKSLQDWCEVLNIKLSQEGLLDDYFALGIGNTVPPVVIQTTADVTAYLNTSLTADTTLQFTGDPLFWDSFAIEFTAYGMGLLGINKDKLLNYDINRYFITRVQDVFSAQIFDTTADPVLYLPIIDAPRNTSKGMFLADTPLYQSCDQRVSVSVSCHLPMNSHVVINNGVQASSRIIAKAFFENNIESTLEFNEFGVITGQRVRARVYADQDHMIKKTDGDIQWNRLASSYRLRYLRFYLHVNYKLFGIDSFSIVEEEFDLDKDDYWQFTCRFISDY